MGCENQKQYKLFYGTCYYPSGGWDDFKGYFHSEELAKEYLEKNEPNAGIMWAHIVFEDKIIRYGSGGSEWENRSVWVWRDEEY